MNHTRSTFLKVASILATAVLAAYAAYALGDLLVYLIGSRPESNTLRLQLATRYAWMGIHILALLPIALMARFASQIESLKEEIQQIKWTR